MLFAFCATISNKIVMNLWYWLNFQKRFIAHDLSNSTHEAIFLFVLHRLSSCEFKYIVYVKSLQNSYVIHFYTCVRACVSKSETFFYVIIFHVCKNIFAILLKTKLSYVVWTMRTKYGDIKYDCQFLLLFSVNFQAKINRFYFPQMYIAMHFKRSTMQAHIILEPVDDYTDIKILIGEKSVLFFSQCPKRANYMNFFPM